MKTLAISIVFSLLLFFTGCVARVSETALIRPTPGEKLANGLSADGRWTVESLSIPANNAAALYAAQFTRPDARAVVLYFGGNGFTISRFYKGVLDIYAPHSVDVVIVDHRGYGASTGTATLDFLLKDAVQAYDFVRTLPQYKGKPIVVHGQSLGSFMAGAVANSRTLDGLVLESSATTAEDWVQGFVDSSMLIRHSEIADSLKGKGNLAAMQKLDEPMLVVVGQNDTTTRPEMSIKLFAIANIDAGAKELLIVPQAGHNDAAKSAEYAASFARLLAKAQKLN